MLLEQITPEKKQHLSQYLNSAGLMPRGYTPRNREELSLCYSLLVGSYCFACKFAQDKSDRAPQQTGKAELVMSDLQIFRS